MLDQPAHRNMAAADAVPGKGEADAQAIVPRRIRGLQPGQGRVHGATPSIRSRARWSRNWSRLARPSPSASAQGSARSEEHTSELQSLMRISYAVFCLKKKKQYIVTYYILII